MKKIKRLLRNLYEKINAKLHPFSPLPSKENQNKFAQTLIDEASKCQRVSESKIHNDWENNRAKLLNLIQKENPINFIDWDVIRITMFHNCSIKELQALKESPLWKDRDNILKESSVGNPPHYYAYAQSSGNLIHHTYNVLQIIDKFSFDIKKIKTVVEFGGGYGGMCRLLYQMGFTGKYTSFDIPEFIAIQRYFLSMIGIYGKQKIDLISKLEDSSNLKNPDLCIMTWSLSESPLSICEQFIEKIQSPRYFLIAYQKNFGEIDNIAYFRDLKNKYTNYTWIEYEIPHLKSSYYLLGKKNE